MSGACRLPSYSSRACTSPLCISRAREAWLVALPVGTAREPPKLQQLMVGSCVEVRKAREAWLAALPDGPAREPPRLQQLKVGSCE